MRLTNKNSIEFARKVKNFYHTYGIGHLTLLLCYFSFILLSAAIFYIIESPTSTKIIDEWQINLTNQRTRFVRNELLPRIFNNSRLLVFIHEDKTKYLANLLNQKLTDYERTLNMQPPSPFLPCNYANSIVFILSTVTTIGHGYIYPVTRAGRYISIASSILGIPLTIIVIKDIAYLMAKLFSYPCILFVYVWHMFRYCTLKPVNEDELLRKIHGEQAIKSKDFRINTTERLLGIPVMMAIFALVGWTTFGCVIALIYLPNADSLAALYFIFNSLTTIGAGDVQPGENTALLILLFGYFLIGLAAVSLFINLLHTKFSKAYWLPSSYYIPLANTECQKGYSLSHLASCDSYEEENELLDSALNHYVTLGVLQAEDKCPLIEVIKREHGYKNETTQTTTEAENFDRKRKNSSPEALIIRKPESSDDNVNNLMTETYTHRPPRLII